MMDMAAVVAIRVVPGASRDRVVGRVGEAVKVQVSAPPEQGKANAAVVTLLGRVLGVRPGQVRVIRGHRQSHKMVRIEGIEQAAAEAKLAAIVPDRRRR